VNYRIKYWAILEKNSARRRKMGKNDIASSGWLFQKAK
jgi:hypothetical protein